MISSINLSSITADPTSTTSLEATGVEVEVNVIASSSDDLSLGMPSERFIRRSQMIAEHHASPAVEFRAEELWQQRMASSDIGNDFKDSLETKAEGKNPFISA